MMDDEKEELTVSLTDTARALNDERFQPEAIVERINHCGGVNSLAKLIVSDFADIDADYTEELVRVSLKCLVLRCAGKAADALLRAMMARYRSGGAEEPEAGDGE